jgi:DNA (cytosine-5)-methyltransferase 1
VRWDPATRGEARADVAGALARVARNGGADDNEANAGQLVTEDADLAFCLKTQQRRIGQGWNETMIAHALTSEGHDASEDGTGRGTPLVASTLVSPGRQWNSAQNEPSLVTCYSVTPESGQGADLRATAVDVASFIGADAYGKQSERQTFVASSTVRRLTPTECERLQGFPDGWTAAAGSDSARYRCLGNAVVPNVVEWVGRRLIACERRATP